MQVCQRHELANLQPSWTSCKMLRNLQGWFFTSEIFRGFNYFNFNWLDFAAPQDWPLAAPNAATFLSIDVNTALQVVPLTSSRFRVAIFHSCYWHHGWQIALCQVKNTTFMATATMPLDIVFCATWASCMTWTRTSKDQKVWEPIGWSHAWPFCFLRKKSLHNGWRKLKRSSLKSPGSQDMPPGKGKAWKVCLLVGSEPGLCNIVPCPKTHFPFFPSSFSQRCNWWCLRNLVNIGSRPFCHGSRGSCFCTCTCRGKSVWKEGCWDAWGKAPQPWVKFMMHHQWDKRNKRASNKLGNYLKIGRCKISCLMFFPFNKFERCHKWGYPLVLKKWRT